jgi:hypothetical protein
MKRNLKNHFEPLYKKIKYNNPLEEIVNYKKDYNELKVIKIKIKPRIYPKQIEKFYGIGAQFKAIQRINHIYQGCPVFAQEILKTNNYDRTFCNFYLISYKELSEIIEKSTYPRFNENIKGVAKLCIDVDIDNEKIKKSINKQIYTDFTFKLINLIHLINKNLKKDFDLDIMFSTKEPLKSDVLILNASRDNVISFHVVYKNVYFVNIVQVGIYLSKILTPILKKGDSSIIPIIEHLDFNIYRENHLLRTYFSVKQNDSTTRFLLEGLETQKFEKQTFLDSLICYTQENVELKCINVESVSYLSDSFYYNQFKYNKNKYFGLQKRVYINQRRNINNTRSNTKNLDLKKECFKKFYEFCNKLFRKYNNDYDPAGFVLQRVYLSDFGTQPFQIPNTNITIVRGKSRCFEVYGKYCPLHKRYHINAKTKTFSYYPFSDLIHLEKCKWKNIGNNIVKIKNPKLRNRFIFNISYRCNFRNVNEGCLRINVKAVCSDFVKEFIEIHKKILEEINNTI